MTHTVLTETAKDKIASERELRYKLAIKLGLDEVTIGRAANPSHKKHKLLCLSDSLKIIEKYLPVGTQLTEEVIAA